MEKSANIKQRSKKWQVGLYRVVLKCTFIALYFSAYYVIINGGLFDEKGELRLQTFAFSVVPAVLGAFLYQIIYYFYKLGTEKKVFGRDPEAAAVCIFVKLGLYCTGATICMLAAHLTATSSRWFALLLFPGAVLCQFLHNNERLSSHISTFAENLSAGIITMIMETVLTGGKNSLALRLFLVTIPLLIIKNVAYHFFSTVKHSYKYVDDEFGNKPSIAPQNEENGKTSVSVPRNARKGVVNRKKKRVLKKAAEPIWFRYALTGGQAVFRACEKDFRGNVGTLMGELKILDDRLKKDIIGEKRAVRLVKRTVRCLERAKKKAGEDFVLPECFTVLFESVLAELDAGYYVDISDCRAVYLGIKNASRIDTDPKTNVCLEKDSGMCGNIIESICLTRAVFVKDVLVGTLILFVWQVLCGAEIFSGVMKNVFLNTKTWLPLVFTFITTGIGVYNFAKPQEK